MTSPGEHREWDAGSYDRVSDPQVVWAEQVLSQAELRGDERVLDVGCGSGRVTRLLVDRVPRGRVVGVDASAAMIDAARAALGDAVELHRADVLELELAEPVDVVFSNATLHWILDHDALFSHLHALMRPGGRLLAQCGGEGNVARILASVREVMEAPRFAASFAGWRQLWHFPGPRETEEVLRRAGFESARCWLSDGAAAPEHPREFMSTVVLRTHLEWLPEHLREPFMDEVMARIGARPTLDYIRLNIDARA